MSRGDGLPTWCSPAVRPADLVQPCRPTGWCRCRRWNVPPSIGQVPAPQLDKRGAPAAAAARGDTVHSGAQYPERRRPRVQPRSLLWWASRSPRGRADPTRVARACVGEYIDRALRECAGPTWNWMMSGRAAGIADPVAGLSGIEPRHFGRGSVISTNGPADQARIQERPFRLVIWEMTSKRVSPSVRAPVRSQGPSHHQKGLLKGP